MSGPARQKFAEQIFRRARSSMVERFPFKESVDSSSLSGLTILEIADSQGGALATPPPVASALKLKSNFAESRRKKKEEKRKN